MRFEESTNFSSSQLDFVPRERRNQGTQMVAAFAGLILALFLFGYVPALTHITHANLLLAAIVAGVGLFVVNRNQQTLDLIMTTEYQNLMFTQALSLGSSFCLFVRRDATITYANDGFRELFGLRYGESKALETLFSAASVAPADRERMLGAIYSSSAEQLIFPITNRKGEESLYVITLEPLPRPSGYTMIRGREYRGERAGLQVLPDLLRATSPDKLDHLLGNTPIGHYATDAFGRIEYVNPAFEQILGYNTGEIVALRLTLPKILHQLGNRLVGQDYTLGEFSGDAILQGKTGTRSECLLFQSVMRDAQGKPTGASGSIIAGTLPNA